MARPATPPPPQSPVLTPDQLGRRVQRLQECIKALEVFDPQKVRKRGAPEVLALETSIDGALSAAFRHGTPAYNRYRPAPKLDHGGLYTDSVVSTVERLPPSVIAAQQASEAQQFLTQGKEQSIGLLQQAIRELEHEIADQENDAQAAPPAASAPRGRKVFVVHGHAGVEHAVAGFLRKLGLVPVILHEQPNEGQTIIEKFEAHSDVGFAVVLLTPDDVGGLKDGPQRPRARQNVILELGYFVGRLGRNKVCPLIQREVELPSDVLGVAWVALDAHDGWHMKLANELRAAGYEFDFNNVLA